MAFHIDPDTGLLTEARQLASPNCDQREQDELSLIVIHNISLPPGEFGGKGVEQLFTNQLDPDEHPYYRDIHTLEVSAHLFIRRDGEIVQFVPFQQRAWHAGVSEYQGRSRCNEFSIGIEMEGTDDQPFEQVQYQALDQVIKALLAAYPSLSREHITGHSDIAPGRKTDPGPCFDWDHLQQLLDAC